MLVSRSQTVTLAVTVWTTAVELFVLSSPGSGMGDKCEQYRKEHELITYWPRCSVEYSMLGVARICNEIHALCGTARTYRPSYILPGEPRTIDNLCQNETLNDSCPDCYYGRNSLASRD